MQNTTKKDFQTLPNSSKYLDIDIDLLSENEQNLIQKYTCIKCKNFSVNPTKCENCKNFYCFKCVNELILEEEDAGKNHTCTNCSKKINLNIQGMFPIELKEISSIKLKCISKNPECLNLISYNNYLIHLESCKFWQGLGRCNKCNIIYNMKEIIFHVKNCNGEIVKCKCCQEKFECKNKNNLIQHENECLTKKKLEEKKSNFKIKNYF